MTVRTFTRSLLIILLLLCLASAARVRAQGEYDDDDDDPGYGGGVAALGLTVEEPGATLVTFSVGAKPDDAGALVRALGESLGGAVVVDREQGAEGEDGDDPGWWFLAAHVEQVARRDGWRSVGRFDTAPLLRALQPLGVKQLSLSVSFRGELNNLKVTGAQKFVLPERLKGVGGAAAQKGFENLYQTMLRTDDAGAAQPVVFSWGYTATDLLRQLAPLFAFLLLPPLFTLWLGWSVARANGAEPEAVWGRYYRYLSRLFNLCWVAWLPVYAWVDLGRVLAVVAGGRGFVAQALGTALYFAVPLVVILLCHLLSSPVYARVGGAGWDARSVVRRVILMNAVMVSPFFLAVLAFDTFAARSHYAGLVMLLGMVVWIAFAQLAGKAFNSAAYALMHGELRDRLRAMATSAGVALKQIYVLPDAPSQLSNAYARGDNSVLITESLLRNLSRREVDAILAHELGHLKARHPQTMSRVAAVVIVVANLLTISLADFVDSRRWSPAFFALSIFSASLVTYFLSRNNERHADSVAVNLTRDAEAFITGLAKLSRLNLMPVDGSAWGDVLNTHPATMQRLRDVAGYGGVTPARFQELLAAAREPAPAEERYAVPDAPRAKAFSAAFKSKNAARAMWSIIATVVITPTLLSLALESLRPSWTTYFAAVPFGVALAFGLYQLVRNFISLPGYGKLCAQLRARLASRVRADEPALCVGFAPAAEQRSYENFPFWDAGLLRLDGDSLSYTGEETEFTLRREQVREVRLGKAQPIWIRQRLAFVRWRDDARGAEGTFYLLPLEARTLLHCRRETARLHYTLSTWLARETPHARQHADEDAAQTPALPPGCNAVTGQPMSERINRRTFVRSLTLLWSFSFLLCVGIRLPFFYVLYALALVTSVCVLDQLPKLRERFARKAQPHAAPSAPAEAAPAYARGSWAESET